ncbi:MAG: AMP-dependent synthetase and ligase [Tardiphaga sp.]|nr:AMP-dependent synthetase and ligase [Tardiphaga sp.]
MRSETASLLETLKQRGAHIAMRWKRYGIWQTVSSAAMAARVTSLARGLRAIGLKDGDVAGMIGDNCAEWVLADLAIVAAGGISAGFDAQSDFDELARLLNETRTRILFVAGDVQLHKAMTVRGRCPDLQTIVVMHQQWDDGTEATAAMPFAELETTADSGANALPARDADAPAFIIYTSGMTGPARGAILSGRAVATQAARAADALGLTQSDERLSLIPIHHALERVVGIQASLLAGTIVNFSESRETALANLVELQPTVVLAPPQLWAKLKGGIELAMLESTGFQRWACRKAFAGGGGGVADWLVLAPIRRRIGLSRARLCLCGGAPMRDDVVAWFETLGRPLTDIYGHAETGGAVALGGRALDGHTFDLDDGGLRVSSDTLFIAYVGHEAAASSGGWASDDIATRDGSTLRVVGRRDHLLGDAAAPFAAERKLTASPFIADAFLHRHPDDRVIAHILMESDAVVKYAQDKSIPFTHFLSLCRSDDIRALIGHVVAETNATSDIKIADFVLIGRALGPDDAEVSPALALRRHKLRDDPSDRAKDAAMLSTLETT